MKNQKMTQKRECDLSIVQLNEIVKDYEPKNKISTEFSEELISKLSISEEGETEITGNIKEWMFFISMIIDLYENEKSSSKDNVEFSLEKLVQNTSTEKGIIGLFLQKYLNLYNTKLPNSFTISGNLNQFERFFEILQELDLEHSLGIVRFRE